MPIRLFRLRRFGLLALGLLAAVPACALEITVSAASSLTDAFHQVAAAFQAAHPGVRVRLNFAASGVLLQQIANGAPVDVFASADQETMDQAQSRGLLRPAGRRDFAANTLVLLVPAHAAGDRRPRSLADLARPAYRRIAIGLPASVPAGRYARAALQAAGLWATLDAKIVATHNVRQGLDYVARGEVDAGFVYATDAALVRDKVFVASTVATAPAVRYPVAVLAGAAEPVWAQRFADFLAAPVAQGVLARFGFMPP
jgi:molybdate transport system substrate-binding protein